MTSLENSALSEICRMCLDDLTSVAEYYKIEGELLLIVSKLVFKINHSGDEKLPLNMCANCFNILIQFNITKDAWLENQQKLEEEIFEKENQEVLRENYDFKDESEVQSALLDDSQGEYDYPVEYIDELQDFTETDYADDDLTIVKNELIEITPSQSRQRQTKKNKAKSTALDSKEKGKDIYQKLLQKCDECCKMIEKNRMEGHKNKHRNFRPYTCEFDGCGKRFYCKLLRRLHRASMHTNQSVECDVCGKTFPSERSLYSHKLRHKNENRYNCLYCERKFNNTNSLKRHHAIHSGIREYSCEYCTSSFYRKFNLDVHVKTVHNKDKSHACTSCTKKFGYARLLREHIRKNHLEENEHREKQFETDEVGS